MLLIRPPSSRAERRTVARLTSLAKVLALVSLPVWAQASTDAGLAPQPTRAAAQAATPVPAVAYRSPFADLPRGVEQGETDWKAANAAVGQFRRGHADVLKWEQEQARNQALPGEKRMPMMRPHHTMEGGTP